jgi:hypothetical protein
MQATTSSHTGSLRFLAGFGTLGLRAVWRRLWPPVKTNRGCSIRRRHDHFSSTVATVKAPLRAWLPRGGPYGPRCVAALIQLKSSGWTMLDGQPILPGDPPRRAAVRWWDAREAATVAMMNIKDANPPGRIH